MFFATFALHRAAAAAAGAGAFTAFFVADELDYNSGCSRGKGGTDDYIYEIFGNPFKHLVLTLLSGVWTAPYQKIDYCGKNNRRGNRSGTKAYLAEGEPAKLIDD